MIRKLIFILVIGFLSASADAGESQVLNTRMDKVNYGIGVEMARSFKQQGIDINPDLLIKGLKDGLSGEKLLISEKDLKSTMIGFQNELMRKQAVINKFKAQENKKKGDAFLAENKTREGVVTLPSGLQYKILKASDGKKPTETDMVVCNYRGTLVDGTEFGNTYEVGQPGTFKVKGGGVIPGWTEALQLMPVGSRWRIFIPPTLAYGEKGAGREIGPNETLIFEIELLAVK